MALKDDILEAVARNLKEFGYPDARADNVTTTRLFSMFGKSMVEDFAEKHADKPEVQAVTAEILADMEKAIEQNA